MSRPYALALALAAGACAALALPGARGPLASLGPRDARAATVSVAPGDTAVDLGNTFSLRIVSDAFPGLKAYKLLFGFNPAILQFLGATAGDVLTGTGRAFAVQVVADVTAPTDTAHVDCAQLVGTTSGPGVLVYFNFKAVGFGDSPIVCDGADFRDALNNSTIPGCAAGMVHVVRPVPAVPVSWGRLKGAYR